MSRIDQALRNWEGTKGTTASSSSLSETTIATPLSDYPTENAREAAAVEVPVRTVEVPVRTVEVPVRTVDVPVRPAAGSPTSRRVVARSRDHAYLQARLVTGDVNSVSLEQYRRVAAVLHEAQTQGGLKTLMVTSALPGEGKSLTIANLAYTLSGSYKRRVLVIDADLRAPSLHHVFGIRESRGLCDALRDGRLDMPFVEVAEGLTLLPAGRPGPTPLADLISDRMGALIREFASQFDWVLVDTPPVGLMSDAQVLARFVGGVVFVIAAGVTPRDAIERAVAELGPDTIVGTVLNRVEDRRIPQANYYNEYYGYGNNPAD